MGRTSFLILLDNGRTKVLADEGKRESLYCIRCGACLNHCPCIARSVDTTIRGFTPVPLAHLDASVSRNREGSLAAVCVEPLWSVRRSLPVKIDIPRILLELRKDVIESKTAAGTNKLERLMYRMWRGR